MSGISLLCYIRMTWIILARAEVTDSSTVSAKRAMKFARTFSETIDEDDDDDFPMELQVEEKEDPLSGRLASKVQITDIAYVADIACIPFILEFIW